MALKRIAHRSSSATGPRTSRARTRARWTRFSSPGLPCAVRRGMERNTSNYAHSASVRVKAGSSSDPNVSAGVGLSTGSWPTNWEPGSALGRSALTRGLSVAQSGHREHAGSFPCVVVVPLYAMVGSLSSSIRRKAAWHPSLLRAPVQRRFREAPFMRLDAASPRTDALFFSVPSRRPYIRGALCELPCPHRMLRNYPLSAHRNSTDSRSSLILKITKMRSSGGDVHRSCSFW